MKVKVIARKWWFHPPAWNSTDRLAEWKEILYFWFYGRFSLKNVVDIFRHFWTFFSLDEQSTQHTRIQIVWPGIVIFSKPESEPDSRHKVLCDRTIKSIDANTMLQRCPLFHWKLSRPAAKSWTQPLISNRKFLKRIFWKRIKGSRNNDLMSLIFRSNDVYLIYKVSLFMLRGFFKSNFMPTLDLLYHDWQRACWK